MPTPALDPIGAVLGGVLGGTMGGSSPAGYTTTTTGQTLAPGGLQNIQDTIAGRYLDPSSNPYLQNTYDAAARRVTPGINSLFEAGGRYGSGAHQGVLGQNLSDLANNIYGTNYQNERTRQFAAATSPLGNTVTSPYFTNPLAGILSGALGGGVLGNSIGGIGGILGGIPDWIRNLFPGGGVGGGGGAGAGYPQNDPNIDPNTGLLPPADSGGDPSSGLSTMSVGNFGGPATFGSGYGTYPKPISTDPYVRRIA